MNKADIAYLHYVLRHKWFVFWACFKMGVPLWRALIHDWSKFTRAEWGPYKRKTFNPNGTRRPSDTGYNPNDQVVEFQQAWLSHQRNRHHWQAWISIGNGGTLSALPIPETYIREMIADWIGAGQAYEGVADPRDWYEANKYSLVLHPATRARIELLLRANERAVHNGVKVVL